MENGTNSINNSINDGYHGDGETTLEQIPYPIASRTRFHDNMNNPARLMESIMSHISLNLWILKERQKIENTLENTKLFDNSDDEDKEVNDTLKKY